jgi:hypothetical protein
LKIKTKWKKKLEAIHKLAKSAINNKIEWKPPKGLVYLKNVPVGELVEVNKQTAIIIEHTEVSTVVHCIESKSEDKQFYLGRHRWSNTTEVKTL